MKLLTTCLFAFFFVFPVVASAQDTRGSNIASLHVAYFRNDLVHDCLGLGVGFEKMLGKKEIVALTIPVTFGIPGTDNRIKFLRIVDGHELFSSVSITPGVKFFLSEKDAKTRYSIGASVFFEAGRQNLYTYAEAASNGKYVVKYTGFGYILTNSLQIQLSHHYDLGITLGTGRADQDVVSRINWRNRSAPEFVGWLMFIVGYRL